MKENDIFEEARRFAGIYDFIIATREQLQLFNRYLQEHEDRVLDEIE